MTDRDPAQRISAFVITAGMREPHIVQATLAAASWVDELILVDKTQDKHQAFKVFGSDYLPNHIRYAAAEFSPTVESTRQYADSLCSHPWRICLDDDEILSPDCERMFRAFVANETADILAIPIKHYIMGRHDPRAVYWPEWRPTLYRKGAIEFTPTVHAGTKIVGQITSFNPDSPVFITHLSHENISAWIEKTNRYTDQEDRSGQRADIPLINWAQRILNTKLQEVNATRIGDEYLEANALLHAFYEIIDGLKRWEAANLPDGNEEFRRIALEVIERVKS